MAIRLKPVATFAKKYVARAQVATDDYKAGIQNPHAPQAEAAIAANDSWKAGLQSAFTRDAFVRGLEAAGTAKWQRKSLGPGATRYAPGVAAAEADYARGFEPIAAAISAVDLPPRFPRGDPRNNARVLAVDAAARAAKVGK